MGEGAEGFSWDDLIGQAIGPDDRYVIKRMVGRGGMGVVFEADEAARARSVAIKFLNPEGGIDQEVLQRFQREGKRFAHIRHPGLVTIYGMGKSRGLLYIASEFVFGRNLFQIIKKDGPMPVDRAIDVVAESADALKALHSQDIIHRDLKPENVMLLNDTGRAKILDFGIAKDLQSSVNLTVAGAYIGTPAYSAPEQIRGEVVDSRSDIFSLGVLFYELITGQVLFKGRDTKEILQKTLQENPLDSTRVKESISGPVARTIAKMIAKKPKHRQQSCDELLGELNQLREVLKNPAAMADSQGLIGFLKRVFTGGE